MSQPTISKPERIALWLERLNRFSQSNQSVASFCKTEGISAPSFYQWKRRLQPSVDIAKAGQGVTASLSTKARTSFAEVEIRPATDAFRVSLPGNVTLELGGRLDAVATVVREVLQASRQLETASSASEAQ